MPVDLSVVVVTWNSAGEILNCLASVYKGSSELSMETYVVDNASRDDTVALVQKEFPQVILLPCDRNLGYAAANNQAIKLASGRNILLLNPDTVVENRALSTMTDYLDAEPTVGAIGPRLLRADGQIQESCLRFVSLWSVLYGYVFGGSYLPKEHTRPSPVQALSGAALMVRRAVVRQVGLLDTDYFMYGEDTDWCYRIRQAGWGIRYMPDAEIVHMGGRSAQLVPVHTYVRRHVAKLIFVRKHRPSWEYRALVHLMQLNIHLRSLRASKDMRRYYQKALEEYDREVVTLETNLRPV